MIAFYGRTLKFVLRHQGAALLVALATLALTIYLYIGIPKGFFPVQDTGVIQGISQAPESVSFPAMSQKQQELAKIILQDPAGRASHHLSGLTERIPPSTADASRSI